MSDTEKQLEPKLDDIGYFRTTDRPFLNTLYFSDLEENFFRSLPDNALIVEMGSGLNQNFANGIKNINPLLRTISIDPSLAINTSFKTVTKIGSSGEPEAVEYQKYPDRKEWHDTEERENLTRESRKQKAKETGYVMSGVAPSVPLAPKSVSLFIDNYGPILYLPREEISIYIRNILKSITEKGEIRLIPIDYYGDLFQGFIHESPTNRNERAKSTLRVILDNIEDIQYEFYEKEDSNKWKNPATNEMEPNIRIGVKIKKKPAN